MPESSIAPYLSSLQKRVYEEGIRVGSYPGAQLGTGVTISLIGKDKERVLELGKEVRVIICLRQLTHSKHLQRVR